MDRPRTVTPLVAMIDPSKGQTLPPGTQGYAMRLRTERLTWREIDDEIVALDLEGAFYFSANSTGAVLMKRLALGNTSVQDLVDALLAEFEVSPETAREDVDQFLIDLEKDGLLDREG
jgi:hypothetical protein